MRMSLGVLLPWQSCQMGEDESGEATIEFIGVVVLFVVPLFYFLWCMGMLQSTAYAAEAAARNAARIVSVNPSHVDAARIQADLAFSDYNIEAERTVEISCYPVSCPQGVGRVVVRVESSVPLPLIPSWVTKNSGVRVQSQMELPIEGVQLK